MKKSIWAIDVGPQRVTAVAAESRPGNPIRVLEKIERPTEGLKPGEIVNIGDLAECLAAIVRDLENATGTPRRAIFYGVDDPFMESRRLSGGRTLDGDGQIRPVDVQQAMNAALRLVGHFETSPVYFRETGYLIDGKDSVMNPVGVFGRQLDVHSHVLLARAEHLEKWKTVFERARLKNAHPVLSVLSSAYGVLDASQRQGGSLLWDLGQDLLCGIVMERGVIVDYAGISSEDLSPAEAADRVGAESAKLLKGNGAARAFVLTGDWAEKESVVDRIQSALPKNPVQVAFPRDLPGLTQPRYAAIAGLLRIAAERDIAGSTRVSRADLVAGLKHRAVSLMNEYF